MFARNVVPFYNEKRGMTFNQAYLVDYGPIFYFFFPLFVMKYGTHNSIVARIARILSTIVLGVIIVLSKWSSFATTMLETWTFVGGEMGASSNGVLSNDLGQVGGTLWASAWIGLVTRSQHTSIRFDPIY